MVLQDSLVRRAKTEVKLDLDLLLLTIFSCLVACYGIKLDNIFVIIGSMLVSPLFDPIVAMVVFAKRRMKTEFFLALKSFSIAMIAAISACLLFWSVVVSLGGDIAYSTTIRSVTVDSFFLAVILGVVGSFIWIWPKSSNSAAGVAIAVSLVPPIALLALAIVTSPSLILYYSTILFYNIAGIFIGSYLVMILNDKNLHVLENILEK
ncbi:MAG: DUF389 domain-containing protein [Pseudomonadales bacterium]|nr:DUF389 domain-containing protein [Candidatus Woesebacteria bacterium]MCB9802065.1 DUF389 domain-containing protein [Pseudomonadales bacterium]